MKTPSPLNAPARERVHPPALEPILEHVLEPVLEPVRPSLARPAGRRWRVVACSALAIIALSACSTAQLDKAKRMAGASGRATMAALPLIGRVVTAYGSPYADLIVAFAAAIAPERDDEDYGDEDYDDEDYDDEDYDNEFAQDIDFGDLDGPAPRRERSDRRRREGDALAIDVLVAEVDVVRESRGGGAVRVAPVRNGETLTAEDNYKVQISCNRDCYAYVAQLDTTGRLDPILPSGFVDVQNPLPADRLTALPSADNWFFLDDSTGIEQIYFILSSEPRPDIEAIFTRISAANENLELLEPVSLQPEERLPLTRGIGGVRTGRATLVTTSDGFEASYVSTVLESIDAELVVTRWFRHE